MNHEIYASQSNLVMPSPSLASVHRYQSQGMINVAQDGGPGNSNSVASNQGAVPPTQI